MADTIHPTKSVEQRLAELEEQFAEMRARVLGLKPFEKDWRRTVGMMPDDEYSRSAARLGREWRVQADKD